MPAPVAQYRVSPKYWWASFASLAITLISFWVAWRWPYAWIAAGLALATSALVLWLAVQRPIEIFESHLKIGGLTIPWAQIRRLDRKAAVPLLVKLTLADKRMVWLLYPGDPAKTKNLLRHLRRYAREALIDGIAYRQFWGELQAAAAERRLGLRPGRSKDERETAARAEQAPEPPRYRLLLEDDEAEVEQMFQRLKAVGHLDPKSTSPKSTTEEQ